MKILLYTFDIMPIGGIETSFYELACYLKSKGYDVGVRYTKASPMRLERYNEAGIDVSKEQVRGYEVCDILLIGSIWRRPTNIRARVTVQQIHADWSDDFWKGAPSAVQMVKRAEGDVDIFACVGVSSSEFVRKLVSKPVVVMNNLAPISGVITRNKHDGLRLAAFTRMSSEKGLENYQALRARLDQLGIKAECRVYTNGDAPDGWTLYDPVPDIRAVLPDIDFAVSLADTESFGYTIAEANAHGVPAIIKRTNSTAEYFTDKCNIILDDISNLIESDLKRKFSTEYYLRERTEANVDSALELFASMAHGIVIIKAMKLFIDLKANRLRVLGELFAASSERASELLARDDNLVEVAS